MNERQFIVLKRNEGKSLKQIADCLNVMNNKKYTSQEIGELYKIEIDFQDGKDTTKLTPEEEMEVNLLKDEFDEFLEVVGEQYRTINWAVRAIKGDRHRSCTCGTTFLRDIITKEGSQHFAYRKCMICERQIKWLSKDQVEYPKL